MKRRTVATDRLICAIAGTALVAVGLGAVAWERGDLSLSPDSVVTLPWLAGIVDSAWWPWLLGAAGLVLIVIGLSWLISHRPGQTVGRTPFEGSRPNGTLAVDINTAARAAAAELERRPCISAASGTSRVDRGQRVIELDVKLEPTADGLIGSSAALTAVRQDLATALDGVPVVARILLRVPRAVEGAARVA